MGSSLAIYHYVCGLGKSAQVIVPNAFPDFLAWMPGADTVLQYDTQREQANGYIDQADLVICTDFNDPKRIGALGDIGCYSLDMVLNAIGYPKPLKVSGYKSDFFGKRPNYYVGHPEYAEKFQVDDFAAAFIRLEGDIILDFRVAWAMNIDTPGDTIILGTEAGLRIPSTSTWNGTVGGPMKIYHEVAGSQVETEIPIIDSNTDDLFYKKIRSFLDAVKTNGTAPVPTSQILYNQAIIDGIAKSAMAGREIEIEIPEI